MGSGPGRRPAGGTGTGTGTDTDTGTDAGTSTGTGDRPADRVMEVDPWAVVLRRSRWYLLCWSHARAARRVLRVDRIVSARPLPDTFTPPPGLDALGTLEEHLSPGWSYPVDVLIDASPRQVTRWLERSFGTLGPEGDGQTRLRASTADPGGYASRLAVLPFAFRVEGSAELRHATADLGRRLMAAATAGSAAQPSVTAVDH